MNTPRTSSIASSKTAETVTGLSRRHVMAAATALLLAGGVMWHAAPTLAAESAVSIPAPAVDLKASASGMETAVVAGGCFWGVQGVFQHVNGVTSAVSGYAGGEQSTARYESVGSGSTGHAEAVKITYDPRQISYGRILQIYFSVAHNPTELNRQGPDRGPQYRSTIFAQSDDQARVAKAYITQLDKTRSFGQPIVTTIEMQKKFFPAEGYHQDYLTLHPNEPYIAYNDIPKVENLKRVFPDSYRASPVLVGKGA